MSMKTWAEKFVKYHEDRPEIYEQFKRFTLDVIGRNKKCGATDVLCRVRWETIVSGTDRWKINQNYAAYYARKFMVDFPQYGAFFATRALRG